MPILDSRLNLFGFAFPVRRMANARSLPARALAACLLLACLPFACLAAPEGDQRHPLEVEALTQPQQVLEKLPAARAALARGDDVGVARLALAEANACRVIANWRCQRRAGSAAIAAADRSGSVYLQVRARIALGRALSRLGDFNSAARILAEAQQKLGDTQQDVLMADIFLAYSSISERLGKLDESYRYAKEGLAHAPADTDPEMRLRLLRNMAHIASARGRPLEARELLKETRGLLPANRDPKLTAEILLEEARSARALGDAGTVEEMGRRIGTIGGDLKNTQLHGLGYETTAQGLQMRGDNAGALALYQKARGEFAALKLQQDELRTVRAIVDLQLKGTQADSLPQSIARLIQLGDQATRTERESAAADFEERLRYAESDAALATANAKTENERLRAIVSENRLRYTLIAGILALCMFGVVAALYLQQRRHGTLMQARGRELEIAVSTDFLTSVHSRRYITDAGNVAVARAIDSGMNLAVAVVDIDSFKPINDRFGHDIGDEVLKAVADAMRHACRESDTLGRYGGEEFAVLLEGLGRDHALAAAERLRQAIADVKVPCGDEIIAPTASVGVTQLSPGDTRFDQLLIRADRALYRAKAQGRNRVVIADQDAEPIGLLASAGVH